MDIFDKLRKDRGPLGKWSDVAHGYMMFPKLEGEIGPKMTFRGKQLPRVGQPSGSEKN